MIMKREIGEKGQVVIPKSIRKQFNFYKGESIIFEVKDNAVLIKKEQSSKEFLKDFLNVPKPKRNLTLKDLKK